MATYTLPFNIGDRVVCDLTDIGQTGAAVEGTVIECLSIGAAGAFQIKVRFPDDVYGNVDFYLPVASVAAV
jgi:hypothetical protein